ncbi:MULTISPECIES: glucose-6-phosphate isomerase [Eubacterium]|uniref:Glucose-6-phosphate isomerase n=1 Tax=Eubacterium album TaxID=2978477 RepID=A0ABT2LZJ2_9FIRM|nr:MULTISPECIES: glucose-6-phosphate isomerase [unclassified Eubacterium (in: firmicutes)]MCT7398706.1 glucose-6-phosphate isomerase [Eubacterium sp. LFL-14]MEE0295211.1 glucose-6-phosphate isomerase [Eubacterium sp.]RGG62945.1 glucose-6-phosphate isomerase [Eubacterium sp. AF17-7]RHR33621.1 glucose-6-phosphate isomerase [Eubacterium sp. AF19-12LB]
MAKVTFDYSKASKFISDDEVVAMKKIAEDAKEVLVNKSGAGNDFLGWIDLPVDYDKDEFARIKAAAKKIQSDSEVLVVIGIGGSYLGARAAIDFLRHGFYNNVSKEIRKTPEIYYAGNSISPAYLKGLLDVVGDRDFSVNIISKSGTTTEPAIAFRIFKEKLEKKYGKEEAAKRIYATTDKAKGALKNLATEEGYESFVVPDDVGGRFSVLTAVGLLPIAVSGADIDKLMEGAASGREKALNNTFEDNDAVKYAAIRNILLRKGKSIEITANYEPSLHYFGEWWKQLYGESEGKDQKGIFPAAVDLTTDLHSMGQFIQDGSRLMFETVVNIEKTDADIVIQEEADDLDGLNYLAGKDMDFVNKSAMNGTILAHTDGNVPNLMVNVPEQNEFYLGELFYMYEFACGVSGYILGVNPFNQPGVESYKKNMFALLGKPGYEDMTAELQKRL